MLTNEARLDVPTTVIATGFPSEQYKDGVQKGWAFLGGLAELRDVTWVDLPTSHWPMWSRLQELAAIIAGVARSADVAQPEIAARAACRTAAPRAVAARSMPASSSRWWSSALGVANRAARAWP